MRVPIIRVTMKSVSINWWTPMLLLGKLVKGTGQVLVWAGDKLVCRGTPTAPIVPEQAPALQLRPVGNPVNDLPSL